MAVLQYSNRRFNTGPLNPNPKNKHLYALQTSITFKQPHQGIAGIGHGKQHIALESESRKAGTYVTESTYKNGVTLFTSKTNGTTRDIVVLAGTAGHYQALDAITDAILWNTKLPGKSLIHTKLNTSVEMASSPDVVYTTSLGSTITIVDTNTGKILSSFNTHTSILPPVIANDPLYSGSTLTNNTAKLYKFTTQESMRKVTSRTTSSNLWAITSLRRKRLITIAIKTAIAIPAKIA
ncbi:MAG TPA: hypothetical protein ACQGQH_10295 [Xylella sp.]